MRKRKNWVPWGVGGPPLDPPMLCYVMNSNYAKPRLFLFYTGSLDDRHLTDRHLLELSKRITNQSDLRDLGFKVLKLESHYIDAVKYNRRHDGINSTAHDLLKIWVKGNKLFSLFELVDNRIMDG